MNEQNSGVAGAQRARGLNEIVFANFQNLAANQSRVTDPTDDAQRENQFVQTRAEKSDHRNREQQTRKREKDVEDITGNKPINPTAVVTCERAENRSDECRNSNDD